MTTKPFIAEVVSPDHEAHYVLAGYRTHLQVARCATCEAEYASCESYSVHDAPRGRILKPLAPTLRHHELDPYVDHEVITLPARTIGFCAACTAGHKARPRPHFTPREADPATPRKRELTLEDLL